MSEFTPSGAELATTVATLYWEIHQWDSDSAEFSSLEDALAIAVSRLKADIKYLPANAELREMPYSEVCMHMKVAGQLMWTSDLTGSTYGGIQLYDLATGQAFSAPITKAEAGLYMMEPVV